MQRFEILVLLKSNFLSLTIFTGTGLKPDAAYVYRVKAYLVGTNAMKLVESGYSNEAAAPTQCASTGVKSPAKTLLTVKLTLQPGVIQKKKKEGLQNACDSDQ